MYDTKLPGTDCLLAANGIALEVLAALRRSTCFEIRNNILSILRLIQSSEYHFGSLYCSKAQSH